MKSYFSSALIFTLSASLMFSGCSLNRKSSRFAPKSDSECCGCAVCQSEVSYGGTASDGLIVNSPVQVSEPVTTIAKPTRGPYSMPPEDSFAAEKELNENSVAPIINEVAPEQTETELTMSDESPDVVDVNESSGDFKPGVPVKLAPFDPSGDLDFASKEKGQASLESDIAKLKAATEQENAAKLEEAKAAAAKIIEDAKLEAARIKSAEIEAAKAELVKLEAAKKEAAKIEAAKKAEAAKAEAAKAEALRLVALKAAEEKAKAKAKADAEAAAEAAKVAKEEKVEKKVETNLLLKKIREEAEAKRRKKEAEEVVPVAPDEPSAFNKRPSSSASEPIQIASNAAITEQPKRIVLKANQVDRKVEFQHPATPPRNSVPALAASFRRGQVTTNSLRGPQHTPRQPAAEATIIAHANQVVEQPTQAPQAHEVATQQLPVRTVLRAVPLSESAIRGRHVQVRFKNSQPAQHANDGQLEKFPLNQIPSPGYRIESLEPRINVEIAEPIQDNTWFERTARNEQPSEDAIPPWRK